MCVITRNKALNPLAEIEWDFKNERSNVLSTVDAERRGLRKY